MPEDGEAIGDLKRKFADLDERFVLQLLSQTRINQEEVCYRWQPTKRGTRCLSWARPNIGRSVGDGDWMADGVGLGARAQALRYSAN